jgi:hypothetical protein
MRTHVRKKYHWHVHKPVYYALLSLLGLATPLALGSYHRKVGGGEGYHQFYTFPKGGARPVILKYGGDGFLHQWISRHAVEGTLGLTNAGEAVKVRMRMEKVPEGLQIHWDSSHTRDFDLEEKAIGRTLRPGEAISVHHTFRIGDALRKKAVIFDGGLRIMNADTGASLLFVPIRILNAGPTVPEPSGGDCHEK